MRNIQPYWAAAILLLLFFGNTSAGHRDLAAVTAPTAAAPEPPTVTVIRTTIPQMVQARARIVAGSEVEIKSKVGGQILEIPCKVGDTVKAGDRLVLLDPLDAERGVQQAKYSLQSTQAGLASAKESLAISETTLTIETRKATDSLKVAESNAAHEQGKIERMRELLKESLCSQEEFDSAAAIGVRVNADLASWHTRMDELKNQERALNLNRRGVEQAAASVAWNEVALARAEDNLLATSIVAPIDGTITRCGVQVGQLVTPAGSGTNGGTRLLTITDLSRLFAVAAVREHGVGLIHDNQAVVVTVEALPGQHFDGRVVQIAPVGQTVGEEVTFAVKIEILEPAGLKPEMTAAVEIDVAEKATVLAVPRTAVHQTSNGTLVKVLRNGKTTDRVVRTGRVGDRLVEICDGLVEGETIWAVGGFAGSTPWPFPGAPSSASISHFGK